MAEVFGWMQALQVDASAGTARARAAVPADDPSLADHFPGHRVLPGSLAIELAAQVAGPLAEEITPLRDAPRWAVLGMIRHAVFRRAIELPAALALEARVRKCAPDAVTVGVELHHAEARAASAELVMLMVEAEGRHAQAIQARDRRVARWKSAW